MMNDFSRDTALKIYPPTLQAEFFKNPFQEELQEGNKHTFSGVNKYSVITLQTFIINDAFVSNDCSHCVFIFNSTDLISKSLT